MSNPPQALVLVVEDNPTNIKVLFDVLQAENIRTLVAKTGESAIEKLASVTPDLILLDVMMPGIDGFETCRQIKQNPATEDIPVIFMTALAESCDRIQGLSLGAVDYITKPFQQEEVLARINIHLKLRQLTKDLEQRVLDRTAQLTSALDQLQQSQLQLVQSEKMSALGQLVAGVAHEINNPVSFIKGNLAYAQQYTIALIEHLQLLQQQTAPGAIADHADEIELDYLLQDLPAVLASMQEGVDRILNISVSLRTFSRADSNRKTAFDIHEGIDSTVLILRHRLKDSGDRPEIIVNKYYGDLPLIECLPGQFNQAMMNLLSNAIDAIEESPARNHGQIEIETSQHLNTVLIRIRDNGSGISAAEQSKIFDYLFTTKPAGRGTGLGLAIVRQIIVEKHGGSITVKSEKHQGTEFTIELPIQAAQD